MNSLDLILENQLFKSSLLQAFDGILNEPVRVFDFLGIACVVKQPGNRFHDPEKLMIKFFSVQFPEG